MGAKVGFGIIGAGMISSFHAKAMQKSPKCYLVGVYDANPAASERMAKEYGFFRCLGKR